MKQPLYDKQVLKLTGASSLEEVEIIQSLWSGYGKIERVKLDSFHRKTAIVKHIVPPSNSNHPRGWNTDKSHQRKLRSYIVETNWYKNWSIKINEKCRIPECYGVASTGDNQIILLEDMDASGFDQRKLTISLTEIKSCLTCLAHFHAIHMDKAPNGLWPIGTYWHLETRPDEFKVMAKSSLKQAANQIDKTLNQCKFMTIVHGDAKLANFCFSADESKVAVLDFQYVGGGCGMKDIAYFLGSCLSENECENTEIELLDFYFEQLRAALQDCLINLDELEQEWRYMYPIAWADFNRFLMGWMPTHQKLHGYSEKMAQKALKEIN